MSTTVSSSLLPILKIIFCLKQHVKFIQIMKSSKQAKLGNQVKY